MSAGHVRHFEGDRFVLAGTFAPDKEGDHARKRITTWLRNEGWRCRRITLASGIAVYTDAPTESLREAPTP